MWAVGCPRCGVEYMTMHRGRPQCHDCDARDESERAAKERVSETMRTVPAKYRSCVTEDEFRARGIPVEKRGEIEAKLFASKLVIMGDRSGAGKSTLAAYGMRRWAELHHSKRGLWLSAYDLAGGSQDSFPKLLREWISKDLVVLDDLGAERLMASSLMAEFLEKREKPLWITTALDMQRAAERYSEHIARRAFEGAVPIQLD